MKNLYVTDPDHGYPGEVASLDYVAASVASATTLHGLTDVNIATYDDYTYIVADNASSKYIKGIVISDHTPTAGNVLYGTGTSFTSDTPDNAGLVTKTGTQTISGDKTFSAIPLCGIAPTLGNQLANKDYVDASIGAAASLSSSNTFTDTNEFQEAVSFTTNATITMSLSGTKTTGINLSGSTFSTSDITLSGGATIWNSAINNLKLTEQQIQFVCTTKLDVDGGVLEMDLTAGSSYIKNTATGAGNDLTLWQAGAFDASLIIQSDGTGTDALKLYATAGNIDIDAPATRGITFDAGIFTFASSKDDAGAFTVTTNTGTSEKIGFTNTQGTAVDAFYITTTAGGMVLTSAAAFTVTTATAGITTSADSATALTLTTNGGTAEKMVLTVTQGTSNDAFKVVATAGGIDIDAALDIAINAGTSRTFTLGAGNFTITPEADVANAFYVHANSGASATMYLYNQLGTSTEAIKLNAAAGGLTFLAALNVTITATQNIDIDATTDITIDAPAARDINITAGEILLTGLDDAAANVSLYTNAGTTATLLMHNNSGTGASALDFQATAGGATFTVSAASTFTTGTFNVTTSSNSATAITMTANGGALEKVILTNTQGTNADAIYFNAVAGGITLHANESVVINTDTDIDGFVTGKAFVEDHFHWKFDFDEKAADFSAAVIAPLYFTETLATTGDITIVADEGGNVTLTTGATTASSAKLLYSGSCLFDGDLNWEFYCRFQIDDITNCMFEVGMETDANDRIVLQVDSAHGNPTHYYLNTVNNTTSDDEDTGVVCTTGAWHTVVIEMSGNTYALYIDGTEVTLAPSGSVRADTVNMKPVLYVSNSAGETKNLLVDFVEMVQERG